MAHQCRRKNGPCLGFTRKDAAGSIFVVHVAQGTESKVTRSKAKLRPGRVPTAKDVNSVVVLDTVAQVSFCNLGEILRD